MDTAPEPFLLLEADEAPRLEAAPPLLPAAALVCRRSSPALGGMVLLTASLLVLWSAWLELGQLISQTDRKVLAGLKDHWI